MQFGSLFSDIHPDAHNPGVSPMVEDLSVRNVAVFLPVLMRNNCYFRPESGEDPSVSPRVLVIPVPRCESGC